MKNLETTAYVKYCINRNDFDLSVAYKALININCLNLPISQKRKELSLKLENRVSRAIKINGLNDNKCFDFIQAKLFIVNFCSEFT